MHKALFYLMKKIFPFLFVIFFLFFFALLFFQKSFAATPPNNAKCSANLQSEGSYCGGNYVDNGDPQYLYYCVKNDNPPTPRAWYKCKNGCSPHGDGTGDWCIGEVLCAYTLPKTYCGNHPNQIVGDPAKLHPSNLYNCPSTVETTTSYNYATPDEQSCGSFGCKIVHGDSDVCGCDSSNCAWGCPDSGSNICNRYAAQCNAAKNDCVMTTTLLETNSARCTQFGGAHNTCGSTSCTAPAAPTVSAPSDLSGGASGTPVNKTISWSTVTDAASYTIRIRNRTLHPNQTDYASDCNAQQVTGDYCQTGITGTSKNYNLISGDSYDVTATATNTCGTTPAESASSTTFAITASAQATSTPIPLVVGLDGVGITGDQAHKDSLDPVAHPELVTTPATTALKTIGVKVDVFDADAAATSTPKATGRGTIAYQDSGTNKYLLTGPVTVSPAVAAGTTYKIRVTVDNHLSDLLTNQTIPVADTSPIKITNAEAGDVVGSTNSTSDNHLLPSDYLVIASCANYNIAGKVACPADLLAKSDLNLDGKVDEFDYNLFLREYQSARKDGD